MSDQLRGRLISLAIITPFALVLASLMGNKFFVAFNFLNCLAIAFGFWFDEHYKISWPVKRR